MAYTTIDDPSAYFTTLLYTGNATDNRNLTNSANAGDFKPDFLWLKERSSTSSHQLHDSTRGSSFAVMSDSTGVEDEDGNRVQAFQTNGFQIGTSSTVNQDTITNVAWQWKANGGTATATISESGNNPAAVVQANPTAGFSIITYTGTGASGTIAHGLGARPKFIIIKNRDAGEGWHINGELITGNTNGAFHFNTDAEYTGGSNNSTASSIDANNIHVISSGNVNTNAQKYVAYVFTEKQGYSKFGTYVGNGNADGTFIYTGFKVAWIMFKKASGAGDWIIMDAKRTNEFNPTNGTLYANLNNAEATSIDRGDCVSNGYKLRNTSAAVNSSGGTYIYIAFAEHPFVSSEGVPTTAR